MSKKLRSFADLKTKEPEHVLVYSTELAKPKFCKNCSRLANDCECELLAIKEIGRFNPQARIEKKGRGGKAVTVLSKLPANKIFLKDFCKYLKNAAGAGGTFYVQEGSGIVEIQGERLQELIELTKKYTFK